MYKFELENVLEIRKQIEDALKNELACIERDIQDEIHVLTGLAEKKEKMAGNIENKLAKGASSAEYLMYSGFINKISMDMENQKQKIMETEKKKQQQRDSLLTAMKNRKALEKIKEKRTVAYNSRQQKMEMNLLDEFSTGLHFRRMD